jgi:hypothetical protein
MYAECMQIFLIRGKEVTPAGRVKSRNACSGALSGLRRTRPHGRKATGGQEVAGSNPASPTTNRRSGRCRSRTVLRFGSLHHICTTWRCDFGRPGRVDHRRCAPQTVGIEVAVAFHLSFLSRSGRWSLLSRGARRDPFHLSSYASWRSAPWVVLHAADSSSAARRADEVVTVPSMGRMCSTANRWVPSSYPRQQSSSTTTR